jgi:uncharacterized protein (DUF1800 family)
MNTFHHRRTAIKQFLATSTAYLLSAPGLTLANNFASLKLPSSTRSLNQEQIATHLINRLGFGPRPGDLALIAEDPPKWIAQQLKPSSLSMPAALASRLNEGAFLNQHPVKLVQEFRSLIRSNQQVAANATSTGMNNEVPLGAPQSGNALPSQPEPANPLGRFVTSIARPAIESRLLRAIESPRQLEEVMVDFWFNHFNVFQGKNLLRVMMGHYEHYAIRPFAMGKFRDLLGATAHHPAMLYYLDNALSAAPGTGGRGANPRGLNENYARELMELHTLGVDGGYKQKDVTELARMLTGWSIQPPNQTISSDTPAAPGSIAQMPGFFFNERIHDNGEKEWLGFQVLPQGQAEGQFALDTLAKHPATAKHISYKLAQYFVSDKPDTALVAKLAQVFLGTEGDITQVLAALFSSEAFWAKDNIAAKFKTPYQYVLSVVRSTGQTPENLQALSGALAAQGMPLYGCATPDGYKNTEAAWLNPDAMTKRINFANNLFTARSFGNALNSITVEGLMQTLGPLVSEPTKKLALASTNDSVLARALVVAGPAMMRR